VARLATTATKAMRPRAIEPSCRFTRPVDKAYANFKAINPMRRACVAETRMRPGKTDRARTCLEAIPMKLVRVCVSLSIGAAIAVACSSPVTQVDDAGFGASSSGSGGGSGTSSDGGSSGGSPIDGGMGCGRSPLCSEPTPVCCALHGFLSCVATGACMGVTTMVGCRPGSCPTDQVCCGTLIGNGVQSTCEPSCTGLGVELCDPSGAGPSCPAGFMCSPLGIVDRKTGYCSPTPALDGGLGGD
jgi:hypothetical protein